MPTLRHRFRFTFLTSFVARTFLTLTLLTMIHPDAVAAQGECPAPPPGSPDIRAMGYYSDAASSVIDPKLKAQNAAAVKPLNDFSAHVARMADVYAKEGDETAARCALTWLDAWAASGAMLGRMEHVTWRWRASAGRCITTTTPRRHWC